VEGVHCTLCICVGVHWALSKYLGNFQIVRKFKRDGANIHRRGSGVLPISEELLKCKVSAKEIFTFYDLAPITVYILNKICLKISNFFTLFFSFADLDLRSRIRERFFPIPDPESNHYF